MTSYPPPPPQYVESTICYWVAFGSGDLIKSRRKGFYLTGFDTFLFPGGVGRLHCHMGRMYVLCVRRFADESGLVYTF